MYFLSKNLQPTTYNLQPNSGFTLIELMISLAVIVSFLGVTFASFARLGQRQTLLGAGATLKNVFRDAQSRAVTGEINCSVCNCDAPAGQMFSGWFVDIAVRELYGDCAGNEFSNKSFEIPADIIVTPYMTPEPRILFKSYPPGVDQTATICLSHPNLTNQYYRIQIDPGGEITGSDGLINSCP